MKKRILGLVLAAIMCLTSANIALAAKIEKEVNLAESFGHFDSEDIVKEIGAQSHPTVTFETSLQKSGAGCMKVDTPGYSQSVYIPAPLVKGETYTLSVDLMSGTGTGDLSIRVKYEDTGAYYEITPAGTKWTQSWTTYTYTWTHTGDTDQGKREEDINAVFAFLYNRTTSKNVQYIDNFSLVAHGNVPDADYSALVYKDGTLGDEERIYTLPDNEIKEVTFSDVNGHWSQEAVETLATYNYVNGMGEGLYSPESNLTRAQFVKMAVDYLRVLPQKYDGSIKDIDGGEWFADYVTTAVNLGIIDEAMTFGGFFYPDKAITREEAATIAAKTAAIRVADKPGSNVTFKDAGKISTWAKSGVKDAVAYGLINGYADGTYRPASLITRAEAAQILFRICELTTRFNIYVDPKTGNDKNAGTKEAPLATVHAARDMARKYNDDMQNNINIRIKGKVVLKDTLTLTNEDSGSNGFNIVYTSWGDEKATFSMGADYTGFTLHDPEKNIYKVQVGKGTVAAQAYFNGKRGILARTIEGLSTDAECVPSSDNKVYEYYISDDRWLLDLAHPEDLRIRCQVMWNDMWVALGSLEELEDGRVKLTPMAKNWHNTAAGSTVGTRVKQWGRDHTRFPLFFENAYEFLDLKGEWYLDKHDGYMYYIPRDGEDMSTMVLTLGEGQTLIKAAGESAFNPMHHIQFKNIKFTETNWLTPILEWGGANSEQNNTPYRLDSTTIREHYPAAIEFKNAWYIDFYDNEFSNLGATGLFMEERVKHVDVIGNEFKDIAAGALVMGSVMSQNLDGTPQRDTRIYNECFRVNNNYIHDVAPDYKAGAALTLGYCRNVEVANNVISNTPYSGMHINWGWDGRQKSGTYMENIRIHHNFINEVQVDRIYDGAPIYTLGAERLPIEETQSYIYENYIKSNRNLGPGIYHDQGSSGWFDHDNVFDQSSVQMVEANFADNGYYWTPERFGYLTWANTPNNGVGSGGGNSVDNYYITVVSGSKYVENPIAINHVGKIYYLPCADWPQEALDIMANAGISDEYKDSFDLEGPKYFTSYRRMYYVHNGETVDLELAVRDMAGNEYDLNDFNITYQVADESIISVSDDLKVTALKEGQSDIFVTAEVGGITQEKTLRIKVVPELDTITANVTYMSMFPDNSGKIQIYSKDVNGKSYLLSRRYAEFTSDDPSIATVSKDGIVTAKKQGTTTIRVKLSYCGKVVEQEVKFVTISYVYDDTLERPYKIAGSEILSPASWNSAKALGNGVSVEGMPQLTKEPIESGLIAFDMIIRNPNGWPTITFGGKNPNGSYKGDDTVYMIGFKSDQVEIQRFNNGERTMIFGDLGNLGQGIAGPGRPNVGEDKFYNYNERVSVIMGGIDEEDGTRIVVIINGEPVIDYIDADENRTSADGYFGVYNNNGGTFEFYPYTGITKE